MIPYFKKKKPKQYKLRPNNLLHPNFVILTNEKELSIQTIGHLQDVPFNAIVN